jgi:hypothetical protein
MTSRSITSEDARARAEQRFQKASQREREAEAAQKAEADRRKATAAKMDHLRALRLAREAGETTPAEAEIAADNEKRRAELLGLAKPAAPKRKQGLRPRKAAVSAVEVPELL